MTEGDSELEIAPKGLANRVCPEPDIIRWVARNIDNPKVSPKDCPDPFAWTLLRTCREKPEFVGFFVEKLWAKLIRPQQEKDDDNGKLDGRVTVEMIEKITLARDKANSDNE